MGRSRRAAVNKLIEQVGVLDLNSSEKRKPREGYGLTLSEEKFFRSAMKRHGAKLWRHGWPDFLVHTEALGYVGVEVKHDDDLIRPNQAATFEALEAAGLRVFVWHSRKPDRLTQWRRFAAAGLAEKARRAAERAEKRRLWEEAQLRGAKRAI